MSTKELVACGDAANAKSAASSAEVGNDANNHDSSLSGVPCRSPCPSSSRSPEPETEPKPKPEPTNEASTKAIDESAVASPQSATKNPGAASSKPTRDSVANPSAESEVDDEASPNVETKLLTDEKFETLVNYVQYDREPTNLEHDQMPGVPYPYAPVLTPRHRCRARARNTPWSSYFVSLSVLIMDNY
jgi:hypothetical protein